MFFAEHLAAAPALGLNGISLVKCWADSINTRRAIAEGRLDDWSSTPCLAPADPDGIGLCGDCRQDILGGDV